MRIQFKKFDPVADAVKGNWTDRWAPVFAQPYLRLMRADRPIGTWLLLWPCFWSIALAASYSGQFSPDFYMLFLFAVGAITMRGAGCTYNDIVDKDFDAQVERTKSRPIPSGQVSVKAAWIFLVAQCLVGLVVLLQFNGFAIIVGIGSLFIVALYPFMKRVTYWPQICLGLAFNWGALLGWAAVLGEVSPAAIALYVAGIFWTLGYDTIYAHQDKSDDLMIGVKSTALRLGAQSSNWISVFYIITMLFFAIAGYLANTGLIYYVFLLAGCLHLVWQIKTLDIDNPDICLHIFRANTWFGLIIFLAIITDMLFTNFV